MRRPLLLCLVLATIACEAATCVTKRECRKKCRKRSVKKYGHEFGFKGRQTEYSLEAMCFQSCKCRKGCESHGDCCFDAKEPGVCPGSGSPSSPPTFTPSPTTSTPSPTTSTNSPPASNSCANRCGSYSSSASCQCDVQCEGTGDCCADYKVVCLGDTPGTGDVSDPPVDTVVPKNCGKGEVTINGKCVKYEWSFASQVDYHQLPEPLAETSAAVVGHELVVFGDGDYLGYQNNPTSDNTKRTFVYNLKSRTWSSTRARRPYWGDHQSVEAYKGKIYVFAGLCCQEYCSGQCNAFSKVQIYDVAKDKWSLGKRIPWNVAGSVSTALIHGKIHLCGGHWNGNALKTCGTYHPDSDSWSGMGNMPHGVHHSAAGTDGQRMYVFGGRIGGNGVSEGQEETQIYDPDTDQWKYGADLPTPRSGMGKAPFLGGEFYVMGGEWIPSQYNKGRPVTSKGTFDVVDIYNPITNTWRTGPDMSAGQHGIHPVLYKDEIIIAGGGLQIDRGTAKTVQVYHKK